MTIHELQDKLTAAQEKVIKCQATLEKRVKKIDKTKQALEADNSRSNQFDYSIAQDDYDTTANKLKELQGIADGWKKRLDAEIDRQNFINENTPEILLIFMNNWKQKVINYYLNRYDSFLAFRKDLQDKEREAQIAIVESFSEYERYRKPKHEDYTSSLLANVWPRNIIESELKKVKLDYYSIRKQLNDYTDSVLDRMLNIRDCEERSAFLEKAIEAEKQALLIDLMNRILSVVGKIVDCTGLHIGYTGLIEGIIKGTDANAKIETIGAGGYNIQRFHFRTLIHKL